MPVVNTALLKPGDLKPENLQIYNGLDCCITVEVFEELCTLGNAPPEIYNFSRALQAPALEMMQRGWRVDEYERQKAITALRQKLMHLGGVFERGGKCLSPDGVLQEFARAVWDKPLNPRSYKQLCEFFYGAMRVPEVWISKKGVRKLSVDREALEKIDLYFHARPIVACIFAIRDLSKQLSVLETEVSSDGRMRTSYNIAGTETGRWSSSGDAFGAGTNLQNLQRDDDIGSGALSLRKIFIADPGWKLCGIDLEQAESREVGFQCGVLFGDWTYLDACERGDLHTTTARMIWPKLPWTGDAKADRLIAERPFYRHFTYRDMSKRGGHGSTYLGTPWTMARHLKVPVKLMEDFQEAFLGRAFPCISRWQRWTAQQLQTTQFLTTPFGRGRHFFGRAHDDATLREAVAYVPQSSTGDRLNLILWRIWRHLGRRVQILAQVHDAVYFQFAEGDDAVIAEAIKLVSVPLRCGNRIFDVPGEAKVGWNWGTYHDKFNPNGMLKWRNHDSRVRQTGLQRVL